jgi:hypothetical protein
VPTGATTGQTGDPVAQPTPQPSATGTTAVVAPGGRPPDDRPGGDPSTAVLVPGSDGGGGGSAGGDSKAARKTHADVVLGLPLPALGETARRVSATAMTIAREPQYPLSALGLVGLFLLIQDLIDRRDPKLAAARATRREGSLEFPDLFGPPGGRA